MEFNEKNCRDCENVVQTLFAHICTGFVYVRVNGEEVKQYKKIPNYCPLREKMK